LRIGEARSRERDGVPLRGRREGDAAGDEGGIVLVPFELAQDGSRNIADVTDTFGPLDTFKRMAAR
jgi:hypothetical protein